MPTSLDIKRRIRSVKNTQQITRAMKFVAAARLRRAQEKAVSARPYAREITRMVKSVALRLQEEEASAHPLLARRPEKRVLLVVVSGERGLAGAFNANVIRRAVEFLRSSEAETLEVMSLGRKSRDAFRKQRWKVIAEHVDITTKAERHQASEIADSIAKLYENYEIDAVFIVFNDFMTVLTQIPESRKAAAYRASQIRHAPGRKGKEGRAGSGRLHLRAASGAAVFPPAAALPGGESISRAGGIGCVRARRAHDRHGFGYPQRGGADRQAYAVHEQGSPGRDHQGNHRGGERRRFGRLTARGEEFRFKERMMAEHDKNFGKVVQVIGPVVDVEFPEHHLRRDLQRGTHRR